MTLQGLSTEDTAAALVSRSKTDCVLMSPSGWPSAHAHLRMLLENARQVISISPQAESSSVGR